MFFPVDRVTQFAEQPDQPASARAEADSMSDARLSRRLDLCSIRRLGTIILRLCSKSDRLYRSED
jgi:hypothetical protein